jgi:hypothetical protein
MMLMLADSILSPTVGLWLFVTAVAVLLLAGTVGRRRTGLVDALRAYVKRSQDSPIRNASPEQDGKDS